MNKIALSSTEVRAAKKKLSALERQLAAIGPLMRGNVVTNGKRHPQPYFSLNKDGKTKLIYLGQSRLATAEQLSKNYRKLIEITEEMTVINMNLLKNDAL